jgi:uncharacterized protein YcfL
MKIAMRIYGLVCAVVLLVGCGSDHSITALEARLKVLEAKGLPDSILSSARFDLDKVKTGKKLGLVSEVDASLDSLKVHVKAAEKWSDGVMQANMARADSLSKLLATEKAGLTGFQLKEADSLFSPIDSNFKKGWYLQARGAADHLDSLMPSLLKDEENAKQVSGKIIGTWTMLKHHREDGANAVEKTKVSFLKDGTFAMDEEMKGQTSPQLKEDWQFLTHGNYGLKGDTILLMTKTEKCPRRIYWNLDDNNKWVKTDQKPYDTVITDGSKDRSIAFNYLKENYKK